MQDERLPSQALSDFKDMNDKHYIDVENKQDKAIATLLNLVLSDEGVAGLLDRLSERVADLERRA